MSTFSKAVRTLRKPIIALVVASIAGTVSVFFTEKMRDNARQELQKQRSLLTEAHLRFQRSDDEKAIIINYLPEYQKLQKQGFIGSEQRINWLDGIRSANQQAELFGIEYKVGPQEPIKALGDVTDSSGKLRQSLMDLNFRLLHEEDLMRFFRALEQQQVGLFSINNCSLERVADIRTLQFQPYLGAKCQLAWISYNESSAERQP
jgi:hypothetical protein